MRDVILSVQRNGDFTTLAPFVLSLERTGYRGRVVLFTSRLKRDALAELRRHGFELEPFTFIGKAKRQPLAELWPLWRRLFALPVPMQAKRWLASRVFHLVYRRHLLYADYLSRHAHEFDRVMLADSKDVFFQLDPFCWNPATGLHVVLEDQSSRIGTCRSHRSWMGHQFGEDYVNRHAERMISCAGTTFGDTASVRQYLDQMISVSMSARSLKISSGDQGIHNYLLIEHLLPNVRVHPNGRGPVLTMGVMNPADIRINDAGQVLNDDGQPAPVLHQYDRISSLQKRLLATCQKAENFARTGRGQA
jgi:hypothetical protein